MGRCEPFAEYQLSRDTAGQPPAYARRRADGGITISRGTKSRFTITRDEALQLAEIIADTPPAKAQLVRYPVPQTADPYVAVAPS